MTNLAVPLLLLAAALTVSSAPTAYEAIRTFNFPPGILPQGVTGYQLNESSGDFRADLNGSCIFSLQDSYQLSYNSTITGRITDNRLTDLRGISVKVLFFWVNILEVVRKGHDLDFSVGVTTASFPLDSFFVSPQCGCGLDCDVLRIRKLKLNTKNPSLSSA
ncbi:unnamed protein product [Vicia faba]|uniref:Uncharacterized protein n=1 Tax=Vicia faba TaxID=3906 RepID=A0AAV0ZZF9_VICFA|nr:unnamed protein product [Vicia faba]